MDLRPTHLQDLHRLLNDNLQPKQLVFLLQLEWRLSRRPIPLHPRYQVSLPGPRMLLELRRQRGHLQSKDPQSLHQVKHLMRTTDLQIRPRVTRHFLCRLVTRRTQWPVTRLFQERLMDPTLRWQVKHLFRKQGCRRQKRPCRRTRLGTS